jgi:molybdenum-dependent DNA-binding transcriptional regulator ModE
MNTWQTYHAENAYPGGTVDIAWLEVFREVAARGSLTAAAQALGYTQPAVSRQVAALEKATGARLFDRLPRGVRLTEEGRFLLAHAEVVLERMRAAADGLQALRNLEAGRLRAGAIDSANAALLPRALAAFRTVHPGVACPWPRGPHRSSSAGSATGDAVNERVRSRKRAWLLSVSVSASVRDTPTAMRVRADHAGHRR